MSEQAAEVNWQAIAEQRDRELRALGERKYQIERERDALRAELARMRAHREDHLATAAAEARVRTQVADAEELTEWATRQRAQAAVAWNPQTKRDLLAYARAYENAAAIVRERAGKGFPSAPAALPDVVGTPDLKEG
jgi:hypothetical protein